MQHVAAVADAARDLESQGDLFVACASSEIPDEVTWSMKNPFSKLSARRSELAHETGLPSAPAVNLHTACMSFLMLVNEQG